MMATKVPVKVQRLLGIALAVVALATILAIINPGRRLGTAGDTGTGGGGPSRCLEVPAAVVAAIQTGVSAPGVTLSRAEAVRSNDFSQVWFVAAHVNGPGLDGSNVGIWATNDLTGSSGTIMGVDGIAHQFTDWPDASTTSAHITQSDDGAAEARACT